MILVTLLWLLVEGIRVFYNDDDRFFRMVILVILAFVCLMFIVGSCWGHGEGVSVTGILMEDGQIMFKGQAYIPYEGAMLAIGVAALAAFGLGLAVMAFVKGF